MIIYKASAERSPGLVPNVTIVMDALAADENLAEFGNRQLQLFRTSLPEFELFEQRTGSLHQREATRLDFTWHSAAGHLRQQLTLIEIDQGAVLVFTASAPAEAFGDYVVTFNAQLSALNINAEQVS